MFKMLITEFEPGLWSNCSVDCATKKQIVPQLVEQLLTIYIETTVTNRPAKRSMARLARRQKKRKPTFDLQG